MNITIIATPILTALTLPALVQDALTGGGYQHLPASVTGPLDQLCGWAAWFALTICLAWLIAAAGRLWAAHRHGEPVWSDASHSIVASLFGAIVCSSAAAVATAILTPF
ncbi:hypothetical protein [Nocardia alni]|uniref:hypothetical protein n=1 Tax=Nocardia alni TaxID=2815723 RepID=UPI0020B1BF45|nr:hypothetical protein [Nocardia alni]